MVDVSKDRAPRGAARGGSLLRTHARWILTVTLLIVASACVLSWALGHPGYRSEARVMVATGSTPSGAPVPPDMETERQVVASRAVTADAARAAGTSATHLQRGLTVTVPADSTVLVLDYVDSTAARAQRGAQAIVDAYVTYRAPQAAVLDPANLPRASTGPNYLLNAAAGLALGLLLGVGSAFIRDRLDDSVRGPDDLAEQTDLPVLASVPRAPARAEDGGPRLVVVDEPDSSAAEAYRQVRGKIARAARSREVTTTVTLVTSAARDDGAAEVAANTAVALARGGDRVLLVEGDLRARWLGELFDVPTDVGLGAVLAGRVSVTDALHNGPVDGLRLLPAGADVPSAPGDLFDERALQKLLGEVPADVDHVVLQAPPVLAAAEACTMAEHAHLLVLVATTGRTSRQDLRAALTELRGGWSRILGVVLCDEATDRGGPLWSHHGSATGGPVRATRGRAGRAQGASQNGHGAPADQPEDLGRITQAG